MKQGKGKRILKTILIVLVAIVIIIQFFPPNRNLSEGVGKDDISTKYAVPANVDSILKVTCLDCHSNNTRYPWYSNVQPVAWWLANHIQDGKRALNFSEFAAYPIRRQYNKLKAIGDEVRDGGMPLPSYTIIHKDAILDSTHKQLIISWADSIRAQIKAAYPADSLKGKGNNNGR